MMGGFTEDSIVKCLAISLTQWGQDEGESLLFVQHFNAENLTVVRTVMLTPCNIPSLVWGEAVTKQEYNSMSPAWCGGRQSQNRSITLCPQLGVGGGSHKTGV